MLLQRLHHVDFVVRDLDRAIERYRRIFGLPSVDREFLEARGVALGRFRLGMTWIVLVQPVAEASPVKQFLDKHGEGFYHIAFEVDDLDSAIREMKSNNVALLNETPRQGIDGWKLVDIDTCETFGAMVQLIQQK